jgi:hypothetical protein
MTIIQGTENLAGKLSSVLLPKLSMAYDVIEHLPPVDVFEEKVEVTLRDDDIPHPTNIWMSQQSDDSCFTDGPNLAVFVFRSCSSICPSRLAMCTFLG